MVKIVQLAVNSSLHDTSPHRKFPILSIVTPRYFGPITRSLFVLFLRGNAKGFFFELSVAKFTDSLNDGHAVQGSLFLTSNCEAKGPDNDWM